MVDPQEKLQADRELLASARRKGRLATLGAYTRLSGPGWLQSAITLGGGSLSSSLYLGVLAGFSLLWLQPLAMILGIVMLSSIGYVAMSTKERPFDAINRHVNPVLGWGWALASLLANMVWALPQYSLATAVLQQNLAPVALGGEESRYIIVGAILVVTTAITWSYDAGGWGVKLYELLLKLMVALIVVCFVGVVIQLSFEASLPWPDIFSGFVPDFTAIFQPAETFQPLLAAVESEANREYWSGLIVGQQRDVLISAAATAVGINMTFLFPYSLLRRGWGKEFRGVAVFDLSTGMFIPFLLATSCVVIASASRFHTQLPEGLPGVVYEKVTAEPVEPDPGLVDRFQTMLEARAKRDLGETELEGAALDAEVARRADALPQAEKRLAATLVKRDARHLAHSLRPLTGGTVADVVFGVGVLGMALSTITLLMLISGFVICEIFKLPPRGWHHRFACLAAATGVVGPFIWGSEQADFWLAIPTSVFGFVLLPIAYLTFFLLMNQRKLLGDAMPRGVRRLGWNLAMAVAAGLATVGSVYMCWVKARWFGLGAVPTFLVLVGVAHFARRSRS
ncbi:MAG: divalent metal cation transporter [Planctomycetota bacterium]|nr:divalent metal cation transporter [Planctomycetota bacterium]